MSDHQTRFGRDVYDQQHEEPRPGGRRRRPVADWGVGDDVFDHMPRSRFSRTAEGPAREGRFTRTEPVATDDEYGIRAELRERDEPEVPDPHEVDVPRGGVDGRRTIAIGDPADVPSEIAAVTADRDLGEPEEPAAPERRTVKIGGRPEGSLEAARYERGRARRPPRTAHERFGARPDRLAMWAVALGVLLILIAILSSQ